MADVMPESASDRKPLPVTVVLPAHNAAATLPRALASVFAQTRPPAEIVVVDDASSDETWQVLHQTSAAHPTHPVTTLRLDRNEGAASARNAGWGVATQEYIAFLDADDAWHPRKLEIQHRWMVVHPEVVLCGHRCEVVADEAERPRLDAREPAVRYFGLGSFLACNRLSTPSVMLRRDVGERFAANKRYSEDYLLWMEIVAAHGAAGFIDLPLAFLFKAKYGVSGLSGNLWQMQLGEVDTLRRLCRMSTIGKPACLLALVWSWMKFLKRFTFLPFVVGR